MKLSNKGTMFYNWNWKFYSKSITIKLLESICTSDWIQSRKFRICSNLIDNFFDSVLRIESNFIFNMALSMRLLVTEQLATASTYYWIELLITHVRFIM